MALSSEWETVYQQGNQDSVWPWSDLVSSVMRYSRPDRQPYRVLELGFGAGANIPFLLSLGVEYYGTEGSATAVERAHRRYDEKPNFHAACCDFTRDIPFDCSFDLIVDRSSLTHNGTADIRACLRRLHDSMRPGAKFIGIDWFSTQHSDFMTGKEGEDFHTRNGFPAGRFKDVGTVHFFDEKHLVSLLSEARFQIGRLEHKQNDVLIPPGSGRLAWWNFVAVKP